VFNAEAQSTQRKTENPRKEMLLRGDVVGVFHGFAHVDVAATGAEVENFAGFAVGWEPILTVDLFAIGYECGDEIFRLASFG